MKGEEGSFAFTTERGVTPRIPLSFQFRRIDTPPPPPPPFPAYLKIIKTQL